MSAFRAKPPRGPLNRSDRLARGLVAAWPFDGKAGPTLRDAAAQKAFNGTLTGATAAWQTSPWGPAVTTSGGDSVALSTTTLLIGRPAFAIGALAMAVTPGFNAGYVFRLVTSGSDDINIGLDGGGSAAFRFIKSISFSGTSVGANAAAVANQWYRLLANVDDAGAMSLWVDGVKQTATATQAGTPSGTLTTAGLAISGGGRDMVVAGAWVWNRPLSDARIRAWSADPFRVHRRPRVPVPLGTVASPPPPPPPPASNLLLLGCG